MDNVRPLIRLILEELTAAEKWAQQASGALSRVEALPEPKGDDPWRGTSLRPQSMRRQRKMGGEQVGGAYPGLTKRVVKVLQSHYGNVNPKHISQQMGRLSHGDVSKLQQMFRTFQPDDRMEPDAQAVSRMVQYIKSILRGARNESFNVSIEDLRNIIREEYIGLINEKGFYKKARQYFGIEPKEDEMNLMRKMGHDVGGPTKWDPMVRHQEKEPDFHDFLFNINMPPEDVAQKALSMGMSEEKMLKHVSDFCEFYSSSYAIEQGVRWNEEADEMCWEWHDLCADAYVRLAGGQ